MSKECDFCKGESMVTKYEEMYIKNNELHFFTQDTYEDGFTEGFFKINYCPICGKKIENRQGEKK